MYQKSWWYDPQFLRYRAWGTEIGKFGSCFVLLPKILAPKITIIWCRFPRYEVRQTEFFANLGHFFLPFYSPQQTRKSKFWKNKKKNTWRCHHFTLVSQKSRSYYASWDVKYDSQNFLSGSFLGHFLPFYLPNNLENQNFGKMKKMPGYIILLHMCTIN